MASAVSTAGRRNGRARRRSGFTIVEILIVVVILGILATIVIPKLSNATQIASESTLKEDLRIMRAQIQIYRFQHNEVMPGRTAGGYDADVLRRQLTMGSNIAGDTGAPGNPDYPYGPYMRQLLTNPMNNKSTVQIVDGLGELPDADDSHGWMYQPETNTFVADSPGTDSAGVAYTSY